MTERSFSNTINVYTILFVILFISILFSIFSITKSSLPQEDAAMLMRYAEHFANGQGIVWNINEKPVDGATDFLFMIIVGLLFKSGLSMEFSIKILGVFSHIITVLLVFLSFQFRNRSHLIWALVASLYLLFGPGLRYVTAFFGTPFFVLFTTISWYYLLKIIREGENIKYALLFSFSALISGLIRPEGVILTTLMLISIIYNNGFKYSFKSIWSFLIIFMILGGAYFLWRWNYFGYPLPNPFYKKGGGAIYLKTLTRSIYNLAQLALPFIPVFILGFYSKESLKKTIGFCISILGFAISFILISGEMNYAARFQYPLLPIVLMSFYPLLDGVLKDIHFVKHKELGFQKKVTLISFIIVISLAILIYSHYSLGSSDFPRDGRYDVAKILYDYRNENYVLATSEAGLLPYYSKWKSIDTYGLNDQWIAHNGVITEEYLDRFKPEIIMFHDYEMNPDYISDPKEKSIFKEYKALKNYIKDNNYIIAASFGENKFDTHKYYVKRDFRYCNEIVERIRNLKYILFGKKTMNFYHNYD